MRKKTQKVLQVHCYCILPKFAPIHYLTCAVHLQQHVRNAPATLSVRLLGASELPGAAADGRRRLCCGVYSSSTAVVGTTAVEHTRKRATDRTEDATLSLSSFSAQQRRVERAASFAAMSSSWHTSTCRVLLCSSLHLYMVYACTAGQTARGPGKAWHTGTQQQMQHGGVFSLPDGLDSNHSHVSMMIVLSWHWCPKRWRACPVSRRHLPRVRDTEVMPLSLSFSAVSGCPSLASTNAAAAIRSTRRT